MNDGCSPGALAWGTFWENSAPPRVASEKRAHKHRLWWCGTTAAWDPIRSAPSASPPHLSGRTERDEGDACVGEGLTKSDQGRNALVESLCTAPSRAGKDASDGKTMVVVVTFSLLTDGSQQFQNNSLKMFFVFCFLMLGEV